MAFGIAYTLFTPVIGFLIDKGLDGLHSIIVGNFIIFLGFVFIGPIPPLKHLASLEVTVSALGTQGSDGNLIFSISMLLSGQHGPMDGTKFSCKSE